VSLKVQHDRHLLELSIAYWRWVSEQKIEYVIPILLKDHILLVTIEAVLLFE